MLDIKFIRENPDIVKENIKKKFQDEKLPLVDEVIELDSQRRANIQEADQLRSDRNRLSKQVGMLMGQAKKDPSKLAEAEAVKKQVTDEAERLAALEKLEAELDEKVHHIMLQIPQIIDPSVPIGPDDSANVEVQRFGEAKVPDFPIPYHTDIMESFDGIDMDAAGRVSGSGFYYLHDGAIFVNVARGALADEAALTKWLQSGGRAVLDVFEEEPLPESSPLWDMENVVLTPHNSFVGEGNQARLWETIKENLG